MQYWKFAFMITILSVIGLNSSEVFAQVDGNVWFPNYNNNKIGVLMVSEPEKTAETKDMTDMSHDHSDHAYVSPLQQVKNGVNPTNVICVDGMELVLRYTDGKPACIKSSSVSKLIERGWAIHILPDYEKNENNNSVIFSVGKYNTETNTVEYHAKSNGYLAKPTEQGNFPAVIMIHEFWGLNDNIKEMAEKLASHGYVVLAVDLYEGQVGKTSDEARQIRGSFEQSQWDNNMNSAIEYLEENFDAQSIGSIGWCFGGGQSLNLALNNAKLDATVIYYGQLVTDYDSLSKISWPVLGIFAGNDSGIPEETIKKFQSTLDELNIENEIIIYPGVNHAFANPSGDRYAPEESKDAWEKTLKFFNENL